MNHMATIWTLFGLLAFACLFVLGAGAAYFFDPTPQNLAGLLFMLGILLTITLWLLVRATRHDNG